MSMYDQFKTDGEQEKEGIWLDYGDFQVRIARAGGANKKFQKTIESMARPYRRAIATESLPRERSDEIMMAAYAASVVRDWKVKTKADAWVQGIENPKGGKPLPFTVENVLATFKILPELYADVQEQASSWALFKAALRESASGN